MISKNNIAQNLNKTEALTERFRGNRTSRKKRCALPLNVTPLHLSGDANLHVNVSVELTSEPFHSELVKRGSVMFRNKSSWIETQVRKCDCHWYDKKC